MLPVSLHTISICTLHIHKSAIERHRHQSDRYSGHQAHNQGNPLNYPYLQLSRPAEYQAISGR
jgi:hypothetical protein